MKALAAAALLAVPFSEFEKVLAPGPLWPLDSGDASLTVLRRPEDRYPKLYRLDHETKEFRLVLDAGGPLRDLWRDDQGDAWYFRMDEGGDENYRVYRLSEDFRRKSEVYGRKGARASLVDASQDGRRLYLLSNHEDKAVFRLYRYEPATGRRRPCRRPA